MNRKPKQVAHNIIDSVLSTCIYAPGIKSDDLYPAAKALFNAAGNFRALGHGKAAFVLNDAGLELWALAICGVNNVRDQLIDLRSEIGADAGTTQEGKQ